MADELLPPLRDFLIGLDLARKPSIEGAAHPLWLDPRNGVPEPGAGDPPEADPDVVLGAIQVMGIPRAPYEQRVLRTDAVDFWIRTRLAPFAHRVADPIIAALADQRQFDLAGLTIVECLLFRPLQFLSSDENGFVHTMQFTFERFA